MARYRHGRQNIVLHAAIVAVAAATTSLWLGRAQASTFERVSPSFDGVHAVGAKLHQFTAAKRRISVNWYVAGEDPPSIAITAPVITSTPGSTDQNEVDQQDSGASPDATSSP